MTKDILDRELNNRKASNYKGQHRKPQKNTHYPSGIRTRDSGIPKAKHPYNLGVHPDYTHFVDNESKGDKSSNLW
jgi:hypothetical protein